MKTCNYQNYKLDIELVDKMLRLVDESDILANSYKHLSTYNLICASAERIRTCAYYINEHMEYPKKEEDFICLFTFVAMLYDCIIRLAKEFRAEIKFDNSIFEDLYENQNLNILDEDSVKDDNIFEYLRSLILAHPTATNRVSFLKRRKEYHVSPWVIVYGENSIMKNEDEVGVRIYSDKQKEIINLNFSYIDIFVFSHFLYNSLDKIIKNIEEIIKVENDNSLSKKINRGKILKNIFEEAKTIFESRFQDTYILDNLIDLSSIALKDNQNDIIIKKLQFEMLAKINLFCDAIDEGDDDKMDTYVDIFFPNKTDYGYELGHYHRTKIYSYLKEESSDSNINFAKQCLRTFYDNYASKYVCIDFDNYTYKDIKTLLRVADYAYKVGFELKN